MSLLATHNANIVFTEYLLYEPILAIFRILKYSVECEVPSAWQFASAVDDPQRSDFVAK